MKDSLQQIEDLFTQGLKNAGENYSRSGEVDFNSSIMQSGRNDFSKALTSEEWKKYNNAITSGVDAGLRINDHSILVECEKGDYAYKLVIYDNTFEEKPINAVYGIGNDNYSSTTIHEVAGLITDMEDNGYARPVISKTLKSIAKMRAILLSEYNGKSGRFNRFRGNYSQTGTNPQNQSNGAGASGANQTNVKFDLRDSEGNQLSKVRQEYFKDSKVRVEDGNLKVIPKDGIKLSDGKIAVVDRRDALHISHGASNKKVAEISQIKQIAETGKLVEDESDSKNRKLRIFC